LDDAKKPGKFVENNKLVNAIVHLVDESLTPTISDLCIITW
jgi:hypothetical protein